MGRSGYRRVFGVESNLRLRTGGSRAGSCEITMDQANIVIIGGGVIGSAIARAVSKSHADVFLLESLPKIGMLTSTRNSGVIHSGIYYVQNSLKARLCVRGNVLTYEF